MTEEMTGLPYSSILVATEGAVRILTINRPAQTNKLSNQCLDELVDALEAAEAAPDCRVVILTAVGEYFCNGGELGDCRTESPVDIRAFGDRFVRFHTAIVRLRKPVIAAVQGHAHGGGSNLVEACDLAVASSEATFAVPEMNFGLAPMMALTGLTRFLSRKGVMEWSLLGEAIPASRAVEIGLVNWVCAPGEVMAKAMAVANRLGQSSPTAMAACKRLYYEADALNYQRQLECGLSMLVTLLKSEDAAEAVTAREQNRAPEWKAK
ncbi:MAG: enoyl-CoA hydratase/isomerase family protein [Rhodopila sp.]|nr:enoyl-CoA hydratase/isomerase family protein [Rhodopila sp.]